MAHLSSPVYSTASSILPRALQDVPYLIPPSGRPDFGPSRPGPGQDRSSSSLASSRIQKGRIIISVPPVAGSARLAWPGRAGARRGTRHQSGEWQEIALTLARAFPHFTILEQILVAARRSKRAHQLARSFYFWTRSRSSEKFRELARDGLRGRMAVIIYHHISIVRSAECNQFPKTWPNRRKGNRFQWQAFRNLHFYYAHKITMHQCWNDLITPRMADMQIGKALPPGRCKTFLSLPFFFDLSD